MVRSLARCCNQFLPALPRSEAGALRDVLKSKSIYDLGDDTTVAGYDADRLNVLKGSTRPLPAHSFFNEILHPRWQCGSRNFATCP